MRTEECERQSGRVEHQEELPPQRQPTDQNEQGRRSPQPSVLPRAEKGEESCGENRGDGLAHGGGAHEEEGGRVL